MDKAQVLGIVGGDVKCKGGMDGAYIVTPPYIQSCEEWYMDSTEREEDTQR